MSHVVLRYAQPFLRFFPKRLAMDRRLIWKKGSRPSELLREELRRSRGSHHEFPSDPVGRALCLHSGQAFLLSDNNRRVFFL